MVKVSEIKCKCRYSFLLESASIEGGLITSYVNEYNKYSPVFGNQKHFEDFCFVIAYHSFQDLFSFSRYTFYQDDFCDDNKKKKLPVIHLTPFDLLFEDFAADKYKIEKDLVEASPRFMKIMDSSIWNYYVPIFPSLHNVSMQSIKFECFHQAVQEIACHFQQGLYDLEISNEYADLNARLVQQSYLRGIHKAISPFLFHSEHEMFDKIKNEQNGSLKEIKQYRWRFLLLDDKSIAPMSVKNMSPVKICKLQILTNNLVRMGFDEDKIWFRFIDFHEMRDNNNKILGENGRFITCVENKKPQIHYGRVKNGSFETQTFSPKQEEKPSMPDDIQIVFDCVKHIDEAQWCLQKYRYEIVLLDYLLDRSVNMNQEYGYQLLKQLLKEKDLYVPGPNNRFYFMFISAFTTAVHERMLAEGFSKSERGLWFVGDGACPTNTPYLFCYQLLLMMEHRLSDLKRVHEGGVNTIIDLLRHIYVEAGSAFKDIRARANDHFNDVLYMRNKYHQLEKDLSSEDEKELNGDHKNDAEYLMKMGSSLLVHSMFKAVHLFSGAFFEHLQHLVYLTAFGTIRQWEELWEEYVFVHNELEEYDHLMSDKSKNIECKDGQHISDAIRNYIINLKENAY